ncbi:M24 family metallopeptidase [Shouchella lonarensis]|uniref:Xaa-Pro aminopeptidase. Metallo peptidase. MEROPS family M24B n=1 Tax=Shouchella lonarensis TaxID=1464122 RepID=A0A1G6GMT2_9BACI|nr:aminopeptidase P family protein [Shouchella lonarensis]SDB83350.1 Xaa-Pro aminopeptidase. Metallo peptidase. MEROPS family M24B [Shouchella lonarensis]
MHKVRIETLKQDLTNMNADFAMIQGKENLFYLTGFRADPHERLIALFILPEELFLVAPKMETDLIRAAGFTGELLTYSDHEDVWALIKQKVSHQLSKNPKAFIEYRSLCYERVLALQTLSDDTFLLDDCEPLLMKQRLIKNEAEQQILRHAAAFADFGVETAVASLRTGITEIELVGQIEYALKQRGIREMSFQPIVLFGENAAQPHGVPGERTLKEGDIVLLDLGVVFDGYCSDITRTIAYGHISDEVKTIYNIVLQANIAACNASKPGEIIGTLDRVAREVIENAGYGDYFPHRLGHGLGIDVHEAPSMSSDNCEKLQVGMTYTIEPGVYVPGVAGVRIEDDVLLTENGAECLTTYPKELVIVPART